MPITNPDTIYYELSSSQNVVNTQFKYCFFKESMNIVVCLYVKQQLDYELIKKAFNIEIERNDCLRLFYKKKGGKLMQYFAAPYAVDKIEQVDFTGKGKAEQDAFFSKDASRLVNFRRDELFRIKLIKTYDGRTGIYFAICHLNMDAMSVFLFFNDLLKVYAALRDHTEMPKPFMPFTEYMEREKQYFRNTEKTAKDEQFFRDLFLTGGEPIYCGINGIKPLEELRKKRGKPGLRSFPLMSPFQDKTKNIKLHINSELSDQIDRYCADNNTAPLYVIQLAMRTYLSKINNAAEDILYVTVCNRRATLADKNTSGSLADGVIVRSVIEAGTKFNDAVTRTGEALAQSFRHANYDSIKSIALLTGLYKTRLFDNYYSLLFSYIPVIAPEGWDIDAEWISNGRFPLHIYIIIVKNPNSGGYDIYYEHRTKILKEVHIRALHDGMTEIIKMGLGNSGMIVGDMIK